MHNDIENHMILPPDFEEDIGDEDDTLTEDELYERLRQEQIDGLNDTIVGIAMCYSKDFMLKEQAE